MSLSQTTRWIQNRSVTVQEHGLAWYAVRLREESTLLGNCGMSLGRATAMEPEFGYMISLPYQGRGYATGAARAVLAECASAGIRRVWSTIRPGNLPSRRVIERFGLNVDRMEVAVSPSATEISRRIKPGAIARS